MKDSSPEVLLSIEETAARLGLRPVTIRMWASMRRISKVKLGRRVLIPETEVLRLIAENTIPRLRPGEGKVRAISEK